MYELVLYEDARGYNPFKSELLQPLNEKAGTDKRAKTLLNQLDYRMKRLMVDGTRCGESITKHIDGDLWELRVSSQRAFFFVWTQNRIVILHAFTKKSNKTPKGEIEKAKAEIADWLERHNGQ